MALEDDVKENTAAIRDMTKALLGQKAPSGAAAGTTAGAGAGTKTPEHSLTDVTEKAVAVKAQFDENTAKELIKTHGKAASLKAVKPENYDALWAACDAKLQEGDGL